MSQEANIEQVKSKKRVADHSEEQMRFFYPIQ
jgi:hypothetical protein